MSNADLAALVSLFAQTHRALQQRAARTVDTALVVRNWLFGYYLVEYEGAGASRADLYGKALIAEVSAALTSRGIKGLSPTNLRKCRAFYEAYKDVGEPALARDGSSTLTRIQQAPPVESPLEESFVTALGSAGNLAGATFEPLVEVLGGRFSLGWTHYVTLLTVTNPEARRFYEIEATSNSWGTRELERQIASSLYERLALSRDKAEIARLAEQGLVVAQAADLIKNPYVLEFLDLQEHRTYSERELETAIIGKLEHFLLELGKGFLFEARQKRFTFDNDHFYVDLVFYNRLLRCYVLLDLKLDKLTHQDLGQMQMYVNYFDRHVKTAEEAPTIGILLCRRKSDALVELTLPEGANIHASEYQLYLPSKEELQKKLIAWTQELEA
jgi:predicted nuclease of restriction endonuclease-like (RecB) superfamily